MAINSETGQGLYAYRESAGHTADLDGPPFQLISACRDPQYLRQQLDPGLVDWGLQKFGKQLKLEHGYSAHSMCATFITTALENGASSKTCNTP
jgi:integrase/recombinase XerD